MEGGETGPEDQPVLNPVTCRRFVMHPVRLIQTRKLPFGVIGRSVKPSLMIADMQRLMPRASYPDAQGLHYFTYI